MRTKPYYFAWDNGVRVMVDRKTGEKRPVNEIVREAAKAGDLTTMDQAMANEADKILKFNPNHDNLGRFSSSGGGGAAAGSKGNYREFSKSEMQEIGASYKEWEDGLSDKEKDAITSYVRESEPFNQKLRTGKDAEWNQATQDQYDALDKAIDKSQIPENMVTYRGATVDMFGGRDPESLVGKTITDKAYVSTSASKGIAELFSGDLYDEDVKPVICKINCKAGARGAYLDNIAEINLNGKPIDYNTDRYKNYEGAYAKEILLPRNSSLKITSVRKADIGGVEGWEVEMDYE